jgi:ABC-type glycerol-3-phosphate transport system substrate-binding protein
MRNKVLSLVLVLLMVSVLAGCGNQPVKTGGQDGQEAAAYKIGVVTPTLSTSEDEFRAADMMAKKYPDIKEKILL